MHGAVMCPRLGAHATPTARLRECVCMWASGEAASRVFACVYYGGDLCASGASFVTPHRNPGRSAMATAAPAPEEEERLCRYCFEGEESGPLISPCACRGDQKYVHLACLRRWQRTVLVSQPTHPAFYERDPRHYKCGVCKGVFTCEPPSRLELMSSFTGPEVCKPCGSPQGHCRVPTIPRARSLARPPASLSLSLSLEL